MRALLFAVIVSLASCAAGSEGEGEGEGEGEPDGEFVRVDIDGVTTTFTNILQVTDGAQFGVIDNVSSLGLNLFINLDAPELALGTYECGTGTVAITLREPDAPATPRSSDGVGGACTIVVTASGSDPGDPFEGTFTATLESAGVTRVLTNGVFELLDDN